MKMSDGMLIYRAGCYLWLRWQYNIITGPVTVTADRAPLTLIHDTWHPILWTLVNSVLCLPSLFLLACDSL